MSNIVKFPGAASAQTEEVDERAKLKAAAKKMDAAGSLEAEQPLDEWQTQLLQDLADYWGPEQYEDPEFGATITRESHDQLTKLFTTFGVSDLDPSDPEKFDLVLETSLLLTNTIGQQLRFRHRWKTIVYDKTARGFSPLFTQYIDALWSGDMAPVKMLARSLGIQAGVSAEQRERFSKQHLGL